jgi:hypothetical protein
MISGIAAVIATLVLAESISGHISLPVTLVPYNS